MPYFTKKPVTIEAVRYTGDNLRVVLEFTGKHRKFNEWFDSWDAYERHVEANDMEFKIFTLEGVMSARPGDWIIKGVKGEFYPCKPDIFEDTYEPAGVSEPAGVKVKPGELERIVWSAMVWARENPGPDEVPEYTDGGNSFAETECRATVARILAALEPGQTHREVWEQAKEAAANHVSAECFSLPSGDASRSYNAGVRDAIEAIRAMPYPGDSQ